MKTYNLNAQPRTDLGKKATKALREQEMIPVVLNGGKIVELPFNGTLAEGEKLVELNKDGKKGVIVTDLSVKVEDVRKLIYTPDVFVIELNVNGNVKKTILKDLQFHPVTDKVLHIDLLEVYEDKPVVVEVPVKLEGHAAGVRAGGKLQLSMKKLKVKAIYSAIPERVVINIDDIQLGQSLQVRDLHYDNFEIVNSPVAVVCAVQMTRAARGAAAAE